MVSFNCFREGDGEVVAEKTWEGGLVFGVVVLCVIVVGVFALVDFLKNF